MSLKSPKSFHDFWDEVLQDYALITKVLASYGGLEGVDMGEGVFSTNVEGNAKGLDIILLIVSEDALDIGATAWLRLEGLMVALSLIFEAANLLK
ncbi:unnamed protein product [Prunus armeniaca]